MMAAVSDKQAATHAPLARGASFLANAPTPSAPVPDAELTLAALVAEIVGVAPDSTLGVDDIPLPPGLDLARPVSELLREGTKRAHMDAEHSAGAAALTAGELELREYVKWLAVLWRVYDAIELSLLEHADNPVLAPTYNPSLLARAPALAADINYLLARLPADVAVPSSVPITASSPASPLPPFPLPPFLAPIFTAPAPPLTAYISRLRALASSAETAPRLLAHAYVRYLGDLSGGQIIGARLRAAYGLAGLDGRRFYFFDLGHGAKEQAERDEETRGDRKRRLNEVKDWYRAGMNAGAADDEKLKGELVKEANLAFALNTHLFSLIPPPPPRPVQPPMRYYERLALEREAKRLAAPPPTAAQRAQSYAVYVLALALSYVVATYVVPAAWPLVEPSLRDTWIPWYNQKVGPWMNRFIRRFYQRSKRMMF
ncbi:hypothetical protein Q5752_003967 [Cryptotrichosporon argae]